MTTKYCHRFAYRWEERSGRKVDIHKMRDAEAFIQLTPIFQEEGYVFGRSIICTPIPQPQLIVPVDLSFLKPNDLLVLTTRPPIDDEFSGALKVLPRSYTALEDRILMAMRKYFAVCARDHIEIAGCLAEKLPQDYKNRANMVFRQKGGAEYRYLRESRNRRWQKFDQGRRTALFLVHDREPWPGGPRLLAAFGVGGNETLVWTYLLRKKFWQKLSVNASCFVMMEMKTMDIPARPNDLSFADDLEVELLLNVPIEGASLAEAS